jgi:hypothetical protein
VGQRLESDGKELLALLFSFEIAGCWTLLRDFEGLGGVVGVLGLAALILGLVGDSDLSIESVRN